MKKLTRQQAIHWTTLLINSITHEDAKSLLFGLVGSPSIEGVNRWLWSKGIGGWYYDIDTNTFCNEAALRGIIEKALSTEQN